MSTALAAARRVAAADRPIRVMVVDDAVVARSLVTRWVEAEPDMTIAASLRTGREAVEQIERSDPDVVVLDVEMPELDGISALPLLLQKKRDLVVIMASTLTRRSAEISMRALSLGAADYVPKPETTLRGDDLGRVPPRTDREDPQSRPPAPLAAARVTPASAAGNRAAAAAVAGAVGTRRRSRCTPRRSRFGLRPFAAATPRVLLIGSSTGGPQALTA